jgi:hypothetical protein
MLPPSGDRGGACCLWRKRVRLPVTIGDDGVIAASLGSYDQTDWDRQINGDTEV